jgi:anti-sigma factor RsiW
MRLAGRILKEPLAATAVTLVFVIGLPLAVAQISAAGGEILGGILALTVFTSLAVTREIRARFWVAAARRARGVEPPPDF